MKRNDNHQPEHHDADDAMLTAYALGELAGADAAAVEARIARDADARRTVDEIREFAGVLATDLAAEPCPSSDTERRAEVERVAEGIAGASTAARGVAKARMSRAPGLWIGLGIAAMLLVCVSAALWFASDGADDNGSWLANSPVAGEALDTEDANRLESLGYSMGDTESTTRERLKDLGYLTGERPGEAPTSESASPTVDPASLERLAKLGYAAPTAPNIEQRLRRLGYLDLDAEEADIDEITAGAPILFEDSGDGDSRYMQEVYRRAFRAPEGAQTQSNKTLMVMRTDAVTPNALGIRVSVNEVHESLPNLQDNLTVSRERIAELDWATNPTGAELFDLEQPRGYISSFDVEVADLGERRLEEPEIVPETTPSTETYDAIEENPFVRASEDSRSTFSIDVDTASYANVRRMLRSGQRPPAGSVRIEELVNYFSYDYPLPQGDAPFAAALEVAACPWAPDHRLVRVGLKGDHVAPEDRPALNLVFLLDVSGSMSDANKLPLVIESMKLLVGTLRPQDRVAIVVYAGASGLVLDSTSGAEQSTILGALDRLQAGGSTNGGDGIRLAYQVAARNFIDGGANRVILATDGDFNVGTTSESELVSLVEEKAKGGVYLTILGYGTGNLKDSLLEAISGKGNGTYGYIDSLREAQKMFVDQVSGTLVTIAKDVKIQVEFNPQEVEAFRLVGYENRKLEHQDFNDDRKDAGEIGAGHTVTALYEVIPAGGAVDMPTADALRYQKAGEPTPAARSGEMLTVNVRYKEPDTPAAAEARRNGEFDPEEPYTDINGNGSFDAGEPYLDHNGNKAWDAGDSYTDGNGNGRYDLGEPYDDRPIAPPVASSKKLSFPLFDDGASFGQATDDFKFASAVASFAMLLRDSQFKGQSNFDLIEELARDGLGDDRFGYRSEFVELVERARAVMGEKR